MTTATMTGVPLKGYNQYDEDDGGEEMGLLLKGRNPYIVSR